MRASLADLKRQQAEAQAVGVLARAEERDLRAMWSEECVRLDAARADERGAWSEANRSPAAQREAARVDAANRIDGSERRVRLLHEQARHAAVRAEIAERGFAELGKAAYAQKRPSLLDRITRRPKA